MLCGVLCGVSCGVSWGEGEREPEGEAAGGFRLVVEDCCSHRCTLFNILPDMARRLTAVIS